MNETCSIPTTIRDNFEPDPTVNAHPRFFAKPTRPILGPDYQERLIAVQQIGRESAEAITRNPAFAFALEAQIEGLEEVFERLARAHPASFREICKGQDLLENLHILLAGGPTR